MVAAARKAFAYLWSGVSFQKPTPPPEPPPRVGDYYADYTTPDRNAYDPNEAEIQALIQGSKVISAKREL